MIDGVEVDTKYKSLTMKETFVKKFTTSLRPYESILT